MTHEPAFGRGYRVLYRGIMAEVIEILLIDRDEPTERMRYRIETCIGDIILVDEQDIKPYQQQLF